MAEQQITLNPGESKQVSFEATPAEARTYQVSVDSLSGSFTALAAPAVEVAAITLDKAEVLGGEEFTIAIAFSNPHDYDVWVRPIFGFGKIVNAGFEPEAVLSGWEYYYEPHGYSGSSEWVDLGHPQHPGSNMPQFVYDPDGIPVLAAGGYCWLKVPAKGQATTSRKWMVSGGAYGVRDVCVKVEDAFYLVYDPGCATRTVGGITVTVNYRSVSIEPLSGVVPDIVTIGTPPGAVTIDLLEIRISGATAYTRVAITNNTGKTLISRPSDWIYTKLCIDAYYAGEEYSYYARRPGAHHDTLYTVKPGDVLGMIFSTTAASSGSSIGDIPPGTTTKTFSWDIYPAWDLRTALANMPEPKKGYVTVRFYQVDQRPLKYIYGGEATELFEGVFSLQWQTWIKPPYLKEKRWIPPMSGIWWYIPGHYADVYTVDGLEFQVWRYTDP